MCEREREEGEDYLEGKHRDRGFFELERKGNKQIFAGSHKQMV